MHDSAGIRSDFRQGIDFNNSYPLIKINNAA